MGLVTSTTKNMKLIALFTVFIASAFAGSQRAANNARFRACQNSVEGTKLHWNCHCGVATKKSGGVMSEDCKAQKEEVIANLHHCAELREQFADNYEMLFEDYDPEFVVENAAQPTDADREFFGQMCDH